MSGAYGYDIVDRGYTSPCWIWQGKPGNHRLHRDLRNEQRRARRAARKVPGPEPHLPGSPRGASRGSGPGEPSDGHEVV